MSRSFGKGNRELGEGGEGSGGDLSPSATLEDDPSDILGKAKYGRGAVDQKKLDAIASGRWRPAPPPPAALARVRILTGHIGSYPVKGYLLVNRERHEALLFDTAYDPSVAFAALSAERLRLAAVFITHTHRDHVGGIDRIVKETGAKVYLHPREGEKLGVGERPVGEGEPIEAAGLSIYPLETPGHTPGGTSYLHRMPGGPPIVFVGDALFAGSVGRAYSTESYPVLLSSIKKKILTLPADTIIFPGHGPTSTVGEEIVGNPFF